METDFEIWEMAKIFGEMVYMHEARLKYLRNGFPTLEIA